MSFLSLSLPYLALLRCDLLIILNVDMLVAAQRVDFVRWELGREAFHQLELVHDLAALVGTLLLGGVELVGARAFLEGDVDGGHLDSGAGTEGKYGGSRCCEVGGLQC